MGSGVDGYPTYSKKSTLPFLEHLAEAQAVVDERLRQTPDAQEGAPRARHLP